MIVDIKLPSISKTSSAGIKATTFAQ